MRIKNTKLLSYDLCLCCPFNMSTCKKISCLRSTKISWWNEFLPHLILWPYQNLEQYSWVSSRSVCLQYTYNIEVMQSVHCRVFHTANWCNPMVCGCIIQCTYLFCNAETVFSPHYSATISFPLPWLLSAHNHQHKNNIFKQSGWSQQ